jgi:hypothetical protein
MSVGHPWPDIIIRQRDIPGLSYNDMFISHLGSPWPDMNIMQMVKHNNEKAPFVVKVQQPLSVLKTLIVQTMHSRSYGGKM